MSSRSSGGWQELIPILVEAPEPPSSVRNADDVSDSWVIYPVRGVLTRSRSFPLVSFSSSSTDLRFLSLSQLFHVFRKLSRIERSCCLRSFSFLICSHIPSTDKFS